MTGEYIHREVQKAKAKYKTNDPNELLDALGVNFAGVPCVMVPED
jgi:hypothetical protein